MVSWIKEQIWRRRGLRADAEALGATSADISLAKYSKSPIVSIQTNYGELYLRPKDTDYDVIRQVFIRREYDFDSTPQAKVVKDRYSEIIRSGETPVIIDAGANIGAASIWFAHKFGEAAIAAVEPDPENVKLARLNTAKLPNVTVFEAAIGAIPGVVRVESNPGHAWASRTHRSETGVQVLTIPQLIDRIPNGRLLLAKVDIEGFESDLFAQNVDWVDEAVAIIVEPHDWMLPGAGTSDSFQKALMGKSRELLIVGENLVFVANHCGGR